MSPDPLWPCAKFLSCGINRLQIPGLALLEKELQLGEGYKEEGVEMPTEPAQNKKGGSPGNNISVKKIRTFPEH